MRVSVKKWGNRAAVRIPAAVMQAAEEQIDEEVDIREKTHKLDELLKGITGEKHSRGY